MIHDQFDDVSDATVPTAAQAEVIDLLDLNPEHRELVRLSRTDQRHVDAIAARLAEARSSATPSPRRPPDRSPAGVP